ncbi:hypothetical protein L7P61_12630 [Aeromonas veronii bv. sobria]|uniref:Uncharacterized protein n=1 Tax=Aeromonas veronii TaxID=654 RepID=A0ABY3MFL5_AERVE|nr:hypothetical protein [Aeromonas veronii]RDU77875.1 hypothetical protein CGZ76_22590 [Aeromonas veronii]RDU84504.1 hypothetical protein CGZ72_12610 [Aeromonas veronii]TEY43679.1 hypothetical protein CIG14_22245 [Aeromonas veronii]TEY70287.1 hypothetical protein CIG16_22120 [Aeromonas veronii]TYD39880.1 hypothetical protein CJF24_21850 [Aeromonas veronii]
MNNHGAQLVHWSHNQGRPDPALAIATYQNGKLTPVDAKLKALIKAGANVRLLNVKGRYYLDCGFVGGGVELPPLENQSPENAPAILPEAMQVQEATNVDPEEQKRLERIRAHREANRVNPLHPVRMQMYLEAAING